MPSIVTRLSLRSKNLFSNALATRHDKVTSVGSEVDRRIKSITAASGAPDMLIDASDYYVATPATMFVFLKNATSLSGKTLYVKIGTQLALRLKPGDFTILHWYIEDASADINIYSNDPTNGVKVEYFISAETT